MVLFALDADVFLETLEGLGVEITTLDAGPWLPGTRGSRSRISRDRKSVV